MAGTAVDTPVCHAVQSWGLQTPGSWTSMIRLPGQAAVTALHFPEKAASCLPGSNGHLSGQREITKTQRCSAAPYSVKFVVQDTP